MTESTRVARVGATEVHLKKSVEVTREVVDDVPQLPTSSPWVVLRYNTSAGKWQNAQTYDTFEDADTAFVNQTKNAGRGAAERLGIGGDRVIEAE